MSPSGVGPTPLPAPRSAMPVAPARVREQARRSPSPRRCRRQLGLRQQLARRPASASARALAVWWSAAAVGSGIRMLGQAPGAELGQVIIPARRHHEVGHRIAVGHRVEEIE